MTLTERTIRLNNIFDALQSTNSPIVKRAVIRNIPDELKDDFQAVLETLAGQHVFGFKYYVCSPLGDRLRDDTNTVRDVIEFLKTPREQGNLTEVNIAKYVHMTGEWSWFFEPIVNRTLRLGIGKSVLPKDGLSPMLAKKYEGRIGFDKLGYALTEKLDGNRCIASYEDGEWVFRSRNGKLMHVNFDMTDMPTEFVYDGEVMSRSQTLASMKLTINLLYGTNYDKVYNDEFSSTSGMINRHSTDKDLVYNIFDIMVDGVTYDERRAELDRIETPSKDIRIVPVLGRFHHNELESESSRLLHLVTGMGGEGIMINLASGAYNHKRTDQLLKLKQVQTMDMEVYDFDYGTGKYEGMIGALKAKCHTEDGKYITCDVGSGLSDEQRLSWAIDFNRIKGKIIEVAYFSMSQNARDKGSNVYSLRFPRMKSVREDKNTTSQF